MPLALLDRDGVINADSADHIRTLGDWQPLPGSLEAIARLTEAGWAVAVCTNQSGIARGYLQPATLDAIHAHMVTQVEIVGGRIDGVYACPHGPDSDCHCRKPRPGLLEQAMAELGYGPDETVMIGDTGRDLDAGLAAGVRPLLVLTGNGVTTRASHGQIPAFDDLSATVDHLLHSGQGGSF